MRLLACLLAAFFALPAAFATAPTARAQNAKPVQVDLELVLLADASGSIDDAEIMFQRQGYAAALLDPLLVRAMTAGQHRRIALTYVEWGDSSSQEVVAAWAVIDGEPAAKAFAEKLLSTPRLASGRNAIGSALLTGVTLIEANAYEGTRKIIDFAGDSANSWDDLPIEMGRQKALAAGITINGLAMLCRAQACSGRPVSYDLEAAFKRDIIGGLNAFVITADGPDTFADAVRRKLFLEVSGAEPPTRLAAERAPTQALR